MKSMFLSLFLVAAAQATTLESNFSVKGIPVNLKATMTLERASSGKIQTQKIVEETSDFPEDNIYFCATIVMIPVAKITASVNQGPEQSDEFNAYSVKKTAISKEEFLNPSYVCAKTSVGSMPTPYILISRYLTFPLAGSTLGITFFVDQLMTLPDLSVEQESDDSSVVLATFNYSNRDLLADYINAYQSHIGALTWSFSGYYNYERPNLKVLGQ